MRAGMRGNRRRRLAGAIVASAALGVGFLSLSGAPAGASAAKGKHATVKNKSFNYKAKTLHVSKGTKVTWVNKDGAVHTATDRGVFNTKKIKHNRKKSITFNRKGTFKYICTLHPFMHGTVVVG